jgi:signal peptidase I
MDLSIPKTNHKSVQKTNRYEILKSEESLIIKHNDGEMEGFFKNTISDKHLPIKESSIRQKIESMILIGLGISYFTTDVTIVDGISMTPTYANHQIIIKSYMSKQICESKIKRNSIVKFKSPEKENSIKRIIAVPGDEIEFDAFFIKVNGKLITSLNAEEHPTHGVKKPAKSIVHPDRKTNRKTLPLTTTIKLKDNEFYVMGDNVSNSIDSRKYGPIKQTDVISIIQK